MGGDLRTKAGMAVLSLLAAAAVAPAHAQTTRQITINGGGPPDPSKPGYAGLVAGAGQRQYLRELATARAQPGRTKRRRSLAYFAHLTDFQLADEESPARIDSLAPVQPNTSAWRPEEALVPATIDAEFRRLNTLTAASPNRGLNGRRAAMDLAILGGDQIDNQQENEALWVRQLIEGGQLLDPNSGVSDYSTCTSEQRDALAERPADEARRYTGLQDYADYNGGQGDGNFYDPDRPAGAYAQWPQYIGLMDSAQRPFVPVGLRRGSAPVPTYAVTGNHETEVLGYNTATESADRLATGCFKPFVQNPSQPLRASTVFASQNGFAVPPDPHRRFVSPADLKGIYSRGTQPDGHGFKLVDPAENTASGGSASYYAWSPKPRLRFITLDTSSIGTGVVGGAEGNLDDPQFRWLSAQLRAAKTAHQLVVLFGHHPPGRLTASAPDEAAAACQGDGVGCDPDPRNSSPIHLRPDLQRLFDANSNVVAYVSAHVHLNRIRACGGRCSKRGNWWSIATSSSTDWPQQQRLIELMDNHDGTLSILATQVDHTGPAASPGPIGSPASTAALGIDQLASLSRAFSFNDHHVVRSAGGDKRDRNVELLVRDPWGGRGAGLCTGLTPTVAKRTVNRAVLGHKRSTNRRAFTKYARKGTSPTIDRYCLAGGGNLRVGYTRGRAVLAMSSSKVNRLKKLKVRSKTARVKRTLRHSRRYRVGGVTFFLAKGSRARIVIATRRGRIVQMGLADLRSTSTKKKSRAFLKAFF